MLIAGREGSASWTTTIKLKENAEFTERKVCFGLYEASGNYKIKNDTIYFDNIKYGRDEYAFYSFAVIKPSKFSPGNNRFDLALYKNINDTVGDILLIVKNELKNLPKN